MGFGFIRSSHTLIGGRTTHSSTVMRSLAPRHLQVPTASPAMQNHGHATASESSTYRAAIQPISSAHIPRAPGPPSSVPVFPASPALESSFPKHQKPTPRVITGEEHAEASDPLASLERMADGQKGLVQAPPRLGALGEASLHRLKQGPKALSGREEGRRKSCGR